MPQNPKLTSIVLHTMLRNVAATALFSYISGSSQLTHNPYHRPDFCLTNYNIYIKKFVDRVAFGVLKT